MNVTGAPAGRALVCDADAMNRRVMSSALAADGLDVAAVDDGRAALSVLRQEAFDVVLLDLLLPPAGGLDVLGQVRRHHRDVPVIMLSAFEHLDRLVTCLELGADDYLHKPLNPVLLRIRVRACLAGTQLRALQAAQRQVSDPQP